MGKDRIRIWFNQTLSSTYSIIENLRAGKLGDKLEFIVSSRKPDHAFLMLGDIKIKEPEDYEGDYIEWMLKTAKEYEVDIIIPKRQLKEVARNKERFEAQGTRVICNSFESIETTECKSSTYYKLFENFAHMIPEHRVVETPEEMDIALREFIRSEGTAVIKADKDEGGDTVRFVKEKIKSNFATFTQGIAGARLSRVEAVYSYESLLNKLKDEGKTDGKPFIVMPYISGHEISVDCYIGNNMQEPIAIARIKETGRSQIIGGKHEIYDRKGDITTLEDVAIAVGKELGLTDSTYNVQFMWDCKGGYKITDVNPRTSGGMYMTMLTGINPVEYNILDYIHEGTDKIEYTNDIEKIQVGRVERAIVIDR